jgi:hypothetical protein
VDGGPPWVQMEAEWGLVSFFPIGSVGEQVNACTLVWGEDYVKGSR